MNIVLLTHYFPPIGGPGARRMLGWVHGFTAAGHQVTVVTPAAQPCDPYYQPGESYTGPAKVVAPAIFDPARLARGATGTSAPATGPEKRGLAARLRPWLLLPDQRRLANGPLTRAAIKEIFDVCASNFTPHSPICRLKPAFRWSACRLTRAGLNNEPTLLLTSSPYNSVHLAGLTLKRRFGERVTWIADFRDDWFHPVFFPHPNGLYRAYNRRLERSVLRAADGLMVVSKRTLEKVRDRQQRHFDASFWESEGQSSDRSKWRWAPNGFDPTGVEAILSASVEPKPADAPVHLLFSGTLWQGHSLVALVAALDAVAERTGRRFRFELAGRVIEPIPTPRNPQLVEIVTAGWKPYADSLAATRQANLLLVHTGPETQDIKIKVFDAAAVRRPALVLGPADSATVRLVREHVADPLIADQNDQRAIEAALDRYLTTQDESTHAFTGVPEAYDRLKQAAWLLEEFAPKITKGTG